MDDATRAAVDRVVNRYPRWGTPEGAINKCSIASQALRDELERGGVESGYLWLTRPREPLNRAHPRAADASEHLTVLVDGEIIDLTRRQWDHDAEYPTVYPSLAAAGSHWGAYYPDGYARESTPVALALPSGQG